jgi:hypothetical protein
MNRNMKLLTKILFAVILLSGPVYAHAKSAASDETVANRIEDRHLSGFNAVNLAGSFDVFITQGTTESVKVEAPDNIIDHIITEVSGGVLKIYNKNDNGFHWDDLFGGHRKIAVYVTAKDLNSINVSGSGDVSFKEGIHTNSLKLRVSGSGDLIGKVDVKTIETSISGSGDVKLSGRADNSTVSVGGSGDYSGRSLVTINTAVRVSGSGDASVNASNKVDASVSGSGDIRYTGGAKSVSSSKSGSGDIERN